MPPLHKISRKHAFTLIEVMVSMTVLSLTLASSMVALTAGYRIVEDARMGTLASQVLQSEMETLRLKNWTEINTVPDTAPFAADTILASASANRFTCTRTMSVLQTDMKQIVLTVAWTSTSGQPKSRRYITYISKGGINDYFYRKT